MANWLTNNIKKLAVCGIIAFALIFCSVPIMKVFWIESTSYDEVGYVEIQRNPGAGIIPPTLAFERNQTEIERGLREMYKQVPVGYVIVHNTDSASDNFTVTITFYSQGEEFTGKETIFLHPGEVKTVRYYTTSIGSNNEWTWDYKISPDRTLVESKTVTLLDYVLHY